MKQLIQSLNDGKVQLIDCPCPKVDAHGLLLQTKKTLISAGTERMLLEFGRASFMGKIRQQPDKVKQVLTKIATDGFMTTFEAVKSKLDQPIALGYCQVGVVQAVGDQVSGFRVGDRVISNGAHAQMVAVNKNLCAKIPDNVSDQDAVFTVLASIGLQGIRLVKPLMGEVVVVIGLGLIGLIAVQLLKANGCQVIGVDFNESRLKLARQFGATPVFLNRGEDPIAVASTLTGGVGVDAVLITASCDSHEPVHQAAQMCRQRGRIVLVGVAGLQLSRADFYEKELSFQVSCSYGPGRYDPSYERQGQDYPIGFVRFTEQRNFVTVLQLMAEAKLELSSLISHDYDFLDAEKAYDSLANDPSTLGIVLHYAPVEAANDGLLADTVAFDGGPIVTRELVVNVIGAGNYASRVLIPLLAKQRGCLNTICSVGGLSASVMAKKYNFRQATTDSLASITDLNANVIVIATRHDAHGEQVLQALQHQKHVFVEKPLCIKQASLDAIKSLWQNLVQTPILLVGFNRRFAPHIQKMRYLLAGCHSPKHCVMTVNAGFIPTNHWTQSIAVGGGRLLGEACHFIDLLRFVVAEKIIEARVFAINQQQDQISIVLNFADQSLGVIHYLANGHKAYAKERLEVFCEGKVLVLNNFIKMNGLGFSSFKKMNLWRQDKGQVACIEAFMQGIKSGIPPIPIDEIFEVQQVCLDLVASLRDEHRASE